MSILSRHSPGHTHTTDLQSGGILASPIPPGRARTGTVLKETLSRGKPGLHAAAAATASATAVPAHAHRTLQPRRIVTAAAWPDSVSFFTSLCGTSPSAKIWARIEGSFVKQRATTFLRMSPSLGKKETAKAHRRQLQFSRVEAQKMRVRLGR